MTSIIVTGGSFVCGRRLSVAIEEVTATMVIPLALEVLDDNFVRDSESAEREDRCSHGDRWRSLTNMLTALVTPHHRGCDAALCAEGLKLGIELIPKLYPRIARQVRGPAFTKQLDELRKPDPLGIT